MFVVDNSISLAWCFKDERTAPIMALLERITERGGVAPQLWPLEAVNALVMAERRARINAATRQQLLAFLRQLPIEIDAETVDNAWTTTATLAERHGLTSYDACYLELALRLGLPLATNDRKLAAAAQASDVPVLPTV